MADFGGNYIFGVATTFHGVRNPNAAQINTFFGINGTQTLFGGSRGWTILVSGWFFAVDLPTVIAAEGIFLSFADGIARPLTDNAGRTYVNTVFDGVYEADPMGPRPFMTAEGTGIGIKYKAAFRCLL